jgi:nucleoside-diphosphate-sugar epimerase
MLRALVLGTGFLGRSIVNSLQLYGYSVESFSQSFKQELTCFQHIGVIQDNEFLRELLEKKPDLIVNTIWITKPGEYLNSESNRDFADFAIKLAELAKEFSIPHLISLGSCAEYQMNEKNVSSDLPLLNNYVTQKIRAYEQSRIVLATSSTHFSWPRIFFAYGPGQNEARLVQSLIAKGRRSEPIVISDTHSKNDWISSFDIADAISCLAIKKLTGPIDIGTGIGWTNLEVWAIIQKELNSESKLQEPIEVIPRSRNNIVASTNSDLFDSGWRPKLSLEEGIRLMIKS